jgi:hypothetical protein
VLSTTLFVAVAFKSLRHHLIGITLILLLLLLHSHEVQKMEA